MWGEANKSPRFVGTSVNHCGRHLSLSDSNCCGLGELFLLLLISGQLSIDRQGKWAKVTRSISHCLSALLDLQITLYNASGYNMSLSQQLQILRGKIPVILGIIIDEREEKNIFICTQSRFYIAVSKWKFALKVIEGHFSYIAIPINLSINLFDHLSHL